jgi:hypothetical protein
MEQTAMSKRKDKAPKLDKTFVYVSCKAPTGIYAETGNKGEPGHRVVLIKGANEGTFNPRDGRFTPTTVGGFGLTQIDAAFWNEWRKTREAFVAEWEGKKLLAVHDSKDEADAWRLDNAESVTGFEPLDPTKMPKGLEAAPTGHAV